MKRLLTMTMIAMLAATACGLSACEKSYDSLQTLQGQ